MDAYEGNRYQEWADYVTYGGLPQIQYLSTLFDETYIKDIVDQNRIERI